MGECSESSGVTCKSPSTSFWRCLVGICGLSRTIPICSRIKPLPSHRNLDAVASKQSVKPGNLRKLSTHVADPRRNTQSSQDVSETRDCEFREKVTWDTKQTKHLRALLPFFAECFVRVPAQGCFKPHKKLDKRRALSRVSSDLCKNTAAWMEFAIIRCAFGVEIENREEAICRHYSLFSR